VTNGGTFSTNPFPGLRPFGPDEEHLFFGREAQVDDLLSRLARRRFVAVVGASGSGKSSLVRAGLLPALHGGFMAAAGSHWFVAVMRPGHSPIAGLARALDASGVTGERTGDPLLRVGFLQAVLERGALGLVEIATESRLCTGESLLLLVDQFEELFRFKAVDATAFVKLLLAAASQSRYPIYVVITMRSDFLGDVSQFRNLPEVISESLFLIPRLTRVQFARAIEGPIRVAGGHITPRLTNRLLNDLEDDADQLPVLQHALMRTWDASALQRSAHEALDIGNLEAIGALSEALSRHGDEVYASLRSDRLREVAEKVFKCLTDRGEDNRGVRRPARFANVCAIVDGEPDEVREAVEAFRAPACSFLMPPCAHPLDDDTMLDISHESLMHIWQRLKQWVDEEALSNQIYRRLAGAALLYREGKAALWRDPDLQIAANWRAQNCPTPSWGERIVPGFASAMEFLEESLAERSRERRERSTRLRAALVALVIVAVALMGLSLLAFSQWRIADASLKVERAERLADMSLGESGREGVSPLLAADAYQMVRTPRTTGAMLEELLRLHALRGAAIPSVTGEAFAHNGALLALVTKPSAQPLPQLAILDAYSLGVVAHGTINRLSKVSLLCGSTESSWFALSDGRSILVYDGIVNGAPLLNSSSGVGQVHAMACLPNRRAVVFIGEGNVLRSLDFDTGAQRLLSIQAPSRVTGIVVSPNGRYLATVSHGSTTEQIALFNLRSEKRVASVSRGSTAAFTPDATKLAWVDGGWIRTARVPELSPVVSRRCACAEPTVLAYGIDGSGPYDLGAAGGSMPVYNADTEVFVTHDDRDVVVHALEGNVAPALGLQKAPAWVGSFASAGSNLVLAGTRAIHVYDLDRYRSQLATASDVSRAVRISDPADGVHAVAFDYRSGMVRILDLGPGDRVDEEFRVHPASVWNHWFADQPETSYDPIAQSVTEAWSTGITQYGPDGRVTGESSWSTLAATARLRGWFPSDPYFLSSRGTYVGLVQPPQDEAPSSAAPPAAIVSTKGGLASRFISMPFVSADESFAIGLLAADPNTAFGLYRLPQSDRLLGVDLPNTAMAALSPDDKTIAYATGSSTKNPTEIQLFDVTKNLPIGPALPGPPNARAVENIAFSDDARFLIATYQIGYTQHVLAIYSIDPADWQRMLCLWGGSEFEQSQRAAADGGIEAPDACTKYAAQMVPRD
jgi:energy-coupling factor transporter ATP-binding protein EcfA2